VSCAQVTHGDFAAGRSPDKDAEGSLRGWFCMAGFGPGEVLARGFVVTPGLGRVTGRDMGSMGSSTQLLLLPVFILLMYFVMFVPNQRKQKKWAEMMGKLKNGDKVTTTSGIRGVVTSVKDDAVQLRVAPDNIKLEFVKGAIASVTTAEE
jgi:preprotein translocase subunit YajC